MADKITLDEIKGKKVTLKIGQCDVKEASKPKKVFACRKRQDGILKFLISSFFSAL